MKQVEKLFSFSLYGSNDIYTEGAICNAELIPKIFGNEYKARFYVMDVKQTIVEKLKSLNAEVIEMKNQNNDNITDYKFFRFLAVKKDNIVFFRDCDSIVSYREKIMVNEFLSSNKKLHIIRDHPNHKEHIMAGLFGVNKCEIPTELVIELINKSNLKNVNQYNVDQLFLAKFIYPLFKKDMLIHDNFNNYYREKDELILKHPKSEKYCGQIVHPSKITDDEIRSKSYKGYIIFNKTKFETMYELIKTFLHYLSVSRLLKRTLIFMDFYVKNEKILMEDYFILEEINRYTLFKRSYNISEFNESIINIKENDVTTNLEKINSKLLIISNESIITTNQDFDEFTLHNIIQLNDKINYKIEEYILEHNLDKYNTIINHSNENIYLENVININNLYETMNENHMTKEIVKLFSGIYRIHVNPSDLIQKFSKRYWHHWDDDFKTL